LITGRFVNKKPSLPIALGGLIGYSMEERFTVANLKLNIRTNLLMIN
jgi:hypothetical protein